VAALGSLARSAGRACLLGVCGGNVGCLDWRAVGEVLAVPRGGAQHESFTQVESVRLIEVSASEWYSSVAEPQVTALRPCHPGLESL
jgi:hypothetical protein